MREISLPRVLFKSFYIDQFDKSQVEMIKDSNDVNRASLDLANKVRTIRSISGVRVFRYIE